MATTRSRWDSWLRIGRIHRWHNRLSPGDDTEHEWPSGPCKPRLCILDQARPTHFILVTCIYDWNHTGADGRLQYSSWCLESGWQNLRTTVTSEGYAIQIAVSNTKEGRIEHERVPPENDCFWTWPDPLYFIRFGGLNMSRWWCPSLLVWSLTHSLMCEHC